MGLPLFFQKPLQDGFGIDPNEFFAKNTIEEIDVRRMDAKAVVDHREMMDAFGDKPVDRQHHVCGVHGMDEVSDDAVNLLPRIDLPSFILFIHDESAIRCRHTCCFRLPDGMNDIKTGWCCPRYGPVRLGEKVSDVSQPGHDLPCLNGALSTTPILQ